ncbi:LacI family DNA-binding transcriptional regulator [Kutzneria viridogrisea]|uniref:HTH lacI-type domain-containing protein n=2 Tax=Kutzneria TaxID=43356 RepID=W5WFA2_9PSEU|nr:LacI family DNA-binding transcriptional regulator [Kutzneria albida]AHH99435.1 hypothetical protein KALB_6075 [Kutzneria albida DSM 43870]MBA8923008.1 DNA-binding LacI/PurR family transcriptional regulator [Kutzneria viridogrisea]
MGNGRAVTLRDVAARAGVSVQTVSNALNAPQRLQADTLATVTAAIRELGYQPNRSARSLRTSSARLIGYCVARRADGVANPMMDQFLHALTAAAEDEGRHVLLFTAPAGAEAMTPYADLIAQRAVDAFVLSDTVPHDPRHRWLTEHGARFASFGRVWHEQEQPGPWVDVDGAAGCAEAVRHLHSLGHKRIAFLGLPPDGGAVQDRQHGWQAACGQLGLPTEGLLVHCADDTVRHGRDAALRLLDGAEPPTALVAASDVVAFGALHCGRPLAVVGFDDTPLAALVPPGLSSVRQPVAEVARTLINLLDDDHERGVLLRPELVVRASSRTTVRES